MTDQNNPMDDIARGTENLLDKGRKAVADGAQGVGDAVDDTRDEPQLQRELRKVGRRVDRYRTEQPVGFAVALAGAAILIGAAIGRSSR